MRGGAAGGGGGAAGGGGGWRWWSSCSRVFCWHRGCAWPHCAPRLGGGGGDDGGGGGGVGAAAARGAGCGWQDGEGQSCCSASTSSPGWRSRAPGGRGSAGSPRRCPRLGGLRVYFRLERLGRRWRWRWTRGQRVWLEKPRPPLLASDSEAGTLPVPRRWAVLQPPRGRGPGGGEGIPAASPSPTQPWAATEPGSPPAGARL